MAGPDDEEEVAEELRHLDEDDMWEGWAAAGDRHQQEVDDGRG